jgi:hypothetical protein
VTFLSLSLLTLFLHFDALTPQIRQLFANPLAKVATLHGENQTKGHAEIEQSLKRVHMRDRKD